MKKNPISQWCSDATHLIKFPPDREAVREELKQHLMDKQADLREQGVPEEEIEARSVAAMGSAEEIAPQLAAIYRPFWGYAYRVCCIILAVCIVVSIPFLAIGIESIWGQSPWRKPHFVFLDTGSGGNALLHTFPNTKIKINDYTFTVTQVILYEYQLFDQGQYLEEYGRDFKIQIKVQHPRMYDAADIFEYIWAEDSLGNVYLSDAADTNRNLGGQKHVDVTYPKLYGFSYYYELTLDDLIFDDFLSKDAQWIDLHYNRDGFSFTIRIDLDGGNTA